MESIMEKNKKILIHVGFHKTGSTFLRDYFMNHPNVTCLQEEFSDFASKPFDMDVPINFLYETPIFISNMRFTVNSWELNEYERVKAHLLDKNLIENYQQKIAKELSNHFKNAKILITTRQEDEFKKSLYNQYILNGGTDSLHRFILKSKHLKTLFDYDRITTMYSDFFGESNVIIKKYEDLKSNPKQFLSELCELLTVNYLEINIKKSNMSLSMTKLRCMRLNNLMIHNLIRFLPFKRRNRLFSKHIIRNFRCVK